MTRAPGARRPAAPAVTGRRAAEMIVWCVVLLGLQRLGSGWLADGIGAAHGEPAGRAASQAWSTLLGAVMLAVWWFRYSRPSLAADPARRRRMIPLLVLAFVALLGLAAWNVWRILALIGG